MNTKFITATIGCLFLLSCISPQPKRFGDGLPRRVPETQGVVSECVYRFIEGLEASGQEVHSFMLLRHGKVVSEGWWYPYKPEFNHIMNSVSKTVTSTAIGFAVKEGLLAVDDKVISFFPDDLPDTIPPRLAKLTVKHLLTMSSGQDPAPTFYITDKNWVKAYLATPIVDEPGSNFNYNSYNSFMLSAIVRKVTGQTVADYLKPRLLDPLGIRGIQFESNPDGINSGGWGVRMKTADMAKLGLFYLQNGTWEGKELLPASWIKEATSVQIFQVKEPTFEQEMYDEGAQGYGYQIWRCTNNNYRADGASGQFIVVMPERDAIVAITARANDAGQILKLIREELYPGLRAKMLTADDMTAELLASKLSSLHLPYPFLTDEEAVTPVKGRYSAYRLEENPLGISRLSFYIDPEGNCRIDLATREGNEHYLFGLDVWRYGKTGRPGPYFLNPRRNPEGLAPFTVAGYSSWTQQQELSLRLLYITENTDATTVCRFDGQQLQISLTNSMRPDDDPILLQGTLEQESPISHYLPPLKEQEAPGQ